MAESIKKDKLIALLLITTIFIIFIYCFYNKESFESHEEKSKAIFGWFKDNSNPKYTKYRSDLKDQSNIVEYSEVMKLKQGGNLTLTNVSNIV